MFGKMKEMDSSKREEGTLFQQRKWQVFGSAILLGTAIYFGSTALITNADGTGSTAGSVDDPLITKSYVDQRLADLVKKEVAAQLKGGQLPGAPTSTSTTTPTATPTPAASASGSNPGGQASLAITVVQLKQGQTLYAGAGAEFIIRTGKTIAVSSDENGIPDVTAGKDIAAGSAIELNHMLVFPREGRGIKPDPKNKDEIFVMVRGTYMIMNADGSKGTP